MPRGKRRRSERGAVFLRFFGAVPACKVYRPGWTGLHLMQGVTVLLLLCPTNTVSTACCSHTQCPESIFVKASSLRGNPCSLGMNRSSHSSTPQRRSDAATVAGKAKQLSDVQQAAASRAHYTIDILL